MARIIVGLRFKECLRLKGIPKPEFLRSFAPLISGMKKNLGLSRMEEFSYFPFNLLPTEVQWKGLISIPMTGGLSSRMKKTFGKPPPWLPGEIRIRLEGSRGVTPLFGSL